VPARWTKADYAPARRDEKVKPQVTAQYLLIHSRCHLCQSSLDAI